MERQEWSGVGTVVRLASASRIRGFIDSWMAEVEGRLGNGRDGGRVGGRLEQQRGPPQSGTIYR